MAQRGLRHRIRVPAAVSPRLLKSLMGGLPEHGSRGNSPGDGWLPPRRRTLLTYGRHRDAPCSPSPPGNEICASQVAVLAAPGLSLVRKILYLHPGSLWLPRQENTKKSFIFLVFSAVLLGKHTEGLRTQESSPRPPGQFTTVHSTAGRGTVARRGRTPFPSSLRVSVVALPHATPGRWAAWCQRLGLASQLRPGRKPACGVLHGQQQGRGGLWSLAPGVTKPQPWAHQELRPAEGRGRDAPRGP